MEKQKESLARLKRRLEFVEIQHGKAIDRIMELLAEIELLKAQLRDRD